MNLRFLDRENKILMELIFNIIIGTIVRLVFNYPGALIRWMIFGMNKPYSFYLKDSSINYSIAAIFFTILIIIYNILF